MGMIREFKEFAWRGNVLDMAVGVVIGIAFGKVISSLVNDIIMPPIGKLMGNADFSDLFIVLGEGEYSSLAAAKAAGAATINYGLFINTVLDFLIVALAIFMVIRGFNALRRREAAQAGVPAEPAAQEKLLIEIRDLLKRQAT